MGATHPVPADVRRGRGPDAHADRDMEIVTRVLDGSLMHRDSTGYSGVPAGAGATDECRLGHRTRRGRGSRITAGDGQRIIAGPDGAEVLVREMHATLGPR